MNSQEFLAVQVADQWLEVVEAEIDAMPTALADVTESYNVGWADAELGKPCDATAHYIKAGEVHDYIAGHQDCVKAMADAAEYADYFADVDFFRHGC